MILREHKRPDGRGLEEIRPLSADVDILPRTHGSALFKRGQTQALTVTTLGAMSEIQRLDGLDASEISKRYIHHYNARIFDRRSKTSKRDREDVKWDMELLLKGASSVIPSEEEFPYAIRLVSDILSLTVLHHRQVFAEAHFHLWLPAYLSNVPLRVFPVGLVTGDNDDDFVMLTDIQGLGGLLRRHGL